MWRADVCEYNIVYNNDFPDNSKRTHGLVGKVKVRAIAGTPLDHHDGCSSLPLCTFTKGFKVPG